jgi:hypothetical protein
MSTTNHPVHFPAAIIQESASYSIKASRRPVCRCFSGLESVLVCDDGPAVWSYGLVGDIWLGLEHVRVVGEG